MRTRFLLAAACLGLMAWPAMTAVADNYPRQTGVDVQHYVFKLTLGDASDEFVGEGTTEVLFTKDGLADVTLDLMSANNGRGMTVTGVKAGPAAAQPADAKYTHENSKLKITLAEPSKAGQKVRFVVSYHGLPGPGMHIGPNKRGVRSFFSENWPDRARGWLPCIDHPSDKATSEFIVTAPAKYQVVANGLLVEEVKKDDGTTVTHWKQSVPIATWLNAIGVSNFAMHKGETVLGTPLQTWVYPEDAEALTAPTEDVAKKSIEFYTSYVGPYPYEKLANVQAAGIGGGTEHSSAIFYGENSITPRSASLVAHEIAHQWFGCSVTEKDWDDVWLSEGFATYFALLYTEHYNGRAAFVTGLQGSRNTVLRTQRTLPNNAVIHNNLQGTRGVLNQLVYQKGSWVLHMLRKQVGDDKFQMGVRAYYKKYRDLNASTEDLRAEMEAASGQKLDWFFEQWLKRPGSPVIEGTWKFDAAAKKISLDLSQVQGEGAGEAFHLPMEVGIAMEAPAGAGSPPGAAGAQPASAPAMRIERIDFKDKKQHFEFAADKEPASIVLDPETWVLMEARVTRQ